MGVYVGAPGGGMGECGERWDATGQTQALAPPLRLEFWAQPGPRLVGIAPAPLHCSNKRACLVANRAYFWC